MATSSVLLGRAGLAGRQRTQRQQRDPDLAASIDASWTRARLLAANLALLTLLAAIIVVVASLVEHVTRQVFAVLFALLTLFLIRRGSQLRRRGLERLGRSVTAWAGVTGSLVVVSAALALQLTSFVPELIALAAGWLLVLGVWKDLSVLVTAAVVLVYPVVWGAFVWDRSLVAAVLIVVAAGAYARAGATRPVLFGVLIVAVLVVVTVAVHQLTHAAAATGFDGSDLLALAIVLAGLTAAGEVESWHEDWLMYSSTIRSVAAWSAIVLAVIVSQVMWVGSWTATTPPAALARVLLGGVVALIILWVAVSRRPVRRGGRLKIASWTLAIVALSGALTHAVSPEVTRWVAVATLAAWGLRAVQGGLRRSRAWTVAGGFTVVLAATVPVAVSSPGLAALVVLLFAVGVTIGGVALFSKPETTVVTEP